MKRNPYHFGALAGYGQIYFQQQRYELAITYWKRAVSYTHLRAHETVLSRMPSSA